jgi:hypothetical protein
MLISASDGGYAVNDAVRVAYDLANLGRRLAGLDPLQPPKSGAQFHFSLSGSVQGFTADGDAVQGDLLTVGHGVVGGEPALALRIKGLARGRSAAALTPTFAPPNVSEMRTYDLQASPRVYPGQTLHARVLADAGNTGPVAVALRVKVYGAHDRLFSVDSTAVALAPGVDWIIEWTVPDFDGQPIQQVGVALTAPGPRVDGVVWLDWLGWSGAPRLALKRPKEPSAFWRQAWVNNVSFFSNNFAPAFRISQDSGTGMIIHGTREWTDYRASSEITPHLCSSFGLAARVQGLRRCYAILLEAGGFARLVKVKDDERTMLAEAEFPWSFDRPYRFSIEVRGPAIIAAVDRVQIQATDRSAPFNDGAIGLVIAEGALSTDLVEVEPVLPAS